MSASHLILNAFAAGRQCDIRRLLLAGELEAARWLLINTYGLAEWLGRAPGPFREQLADLPELPTMNYRKKAA